ncbi:hypothetical protein PFISCL1PPCAC_28685 [Pristionchus fissidentatus]|uniref:Uncharacterized protein n=1 Tax=Pristionchus fissidentatus TaxID=1538716 RepID=A0AAV5X2I8_9BILA|nr:hypothetical protein PFISCL1PPCAC_28685 [Pristionchus fissidentatus]
MLFPLSLHPPSYNRLSSYIFRVFCYAVSELDIITLYVLNSGLWDTSLVNDCIYSSSLLTNLLAEKLHQLCTGPLDSRHWSSLHYWNRVSRYFHGDSTQRPYSTIIIRRTLHHIHNICHLLQSYHERRERVQLSCHIFRLHLGVSLLCY